MPDNEMIELPELPLGLPLLAHMQNHVNEVSHMAEAEGLSKKEAEMLRAVAGDMQDMIRFHEREKRFESGNDSFAVVLDGADQTVTWQTYRDSDLISSVPLNKQALETIHDAVCHVLEMLYPEGPSVDGN